MSYPKWPVFCIFAWIGTIAALLLHASSPAMAGLAKAKMHGKYPHVTSLNINPAPIIDVKGSGRYISDGDTEPSPQDYTLFDSLAVDSGSVTRTFWIYNTGNADLEISGPLTSSNEEEFAVTQPVKLVLLPGDSISFDITFIAFHDGDIMASIDIPNNSSADDVFSFTVAGIGIGFFDMAVEGNQQFIANADFIPDVADSTDFGVVKVPNHTVTATYRVFNKGNVDLIISVDISDTLNFRISQPVKTIIPRGDSTSFTVTFDPTLHDSLFAGVIIPNNTPDKSLYIFAVQGVGLDAAQIMVYGNHQLIENSDTIPSVADSTDFGAVSIYTGMATRTYWILNGSTVDLHLTDSIVTNNDVFSILQPKETTIPPKDSVSFEITFDPGIPGDTTALVSIPNDDEDQNPFTFLVKGAGSEHIDLPDPGNGEGKTHIVVKGNQQIILQGDTIPSVADSTDFGRVSRSQGSITKTYWIINQSTDSLQLTNDILTNNQAFSISQPAETTIQPNDSTSFSITFDPEDLGDVTAFVVILNDNSEHSPYIFAIRGEGTGYIEATLKGNDQVIFSGDTIPSIEDHTDFDSLYINKGSASKTNTYWVVNTGVDSLFITTPIISSSEIFIIDQPAISKLAAGDSVSFNITFASETEGSFAATIYILNDDVARNPYAFKVEGTYITYINDMPVAVDDYFAIEKNAKLSANILTGDGADSLSNNMPNTVYLEEDVNSGILQLNEDGTFIYDPFPNFWGTDTFTYLLCDVENDCSEATVTITVSGAGITIYNAFSPDGDGVNDVWEIDNITNYTFNKVAIFNRWGNKVWEGANYDNQQVLWQGLSNTGSELSDGTYFYLVEVEELGKQQGYVVISRQR